MGYKSEMRKKSEKVGVREWIKKWGKKSNWARELDKRVGWEN